MKVLTIFTLLFMLLLGSGCGSNDAPVVDEHEHESETESEHKDSHEDEHEHEHAAAMEMLVVPSLTPVDEGKRPFIVATTSIIGDVVAQVGGEAIDLTVLMAAGQDPHSYEPAAQQLTAVSTSDIIFVNGWDLEESLIRSLVAIGDDVPLVPVSAGIEPLAFNGNETLADPHVWFDVANVKQWTTTIADSLSTIDPANADIYAANATAYQAELDELDSYLHEAMDSIPAENRRLVTNHGAFNYFANAYDVEIVGTVIPSLSALAEPSAGEMAALISIMNAQNICAIFTETTLSDNLAQTMAAELDGCEKTAVSKLYTGAIGTADSGANSYISMMKANADAITNGLGK